MRRHVFVMARIVVVLAVAWVTIGPGKANLLSAIGGHCGLACSSSSENNCSGTCGVTTQKCCQCNGEGYIASCQLGTDPCPVIAAGCFCTTTGRNGACHCLNGTNSCGPGTY
jgi:hypothetical protein